MILRSPTENENAAFVIPAWIAGIQVRKDASEDVHVTLDSSNPCWNDVIEELRLQITEVPPRIFKGRGQEDSRREKVILSGNPFLRAFLLFVCFVCSLYGCLSSR